jgi:putative PIN family toxin of toxin-antitoxin system
VRVVLDTNVFVSGVFFSGPPHRILQAWRRGRLQLVVSPEILAEYNRVGEELAERFHGIDLRPILDFVAVTADMISPVAPAAPICSDPDDDKFFLCAISAACKWIVSGDKHLLAKSGYGGVEVMKPRDFIEKFLSHQR